MKRRKSIETRTLTIVGVTTLRTVVTTVTVATVVTVVATIVDDGM